MATHSTGKKAAVKKKAATKKKTAVKKKAAPHRAGKKKTAVKKKAAAKKAAIAATALVIQLCAPGKRCKQRTDGSFIRQNFIGGKWVQVSGTTFPTLQACKNACGG